MSNPIPAPTVDELKLAVSSMYMLLVKVATAVDQGDLYEAQTALRTANFSQTVSDVKKTIAEAVAAEDFKFKPGDVVEFKNFHSKMVRFTVTERINSVEDGKVYKWVSPDGEDDWLSETFIRRAGSSFEDAMKHVYHGGKVAREVWMDGSYLTSDIGRQLLCVCDGKRSPATFVMADVLAKDWKVLA